MGGDGGLEGLGGDMHGYPTGMGAGAEPLGAFDNEDPSLIQNAGPQSVDDKSKCFFVVSFYTCYFFTLEVGDR